MNNAIVCLIVLHYREIMCIIVNIKQGWQGFHCIDLYFCLVPPGKGHLFLSVCLGFLGKTTSFITMMEDMLLLQHMRRAHLNVRIYGCTKIRYFWCIPPNTSSHTAVQEVCLNWNNNHDHKVTKRVMVTPMWANTVKCLNYAVQQQQILT